VHAGPSCSRSDSTCIRSDPTELIQKAVQPAFTDLHIGEELSNSEESAGSEAFAEFQEEAAKVMMEMADVHDAAVEPLTEFANSDELKQLVQDITANRVSTSIPGAAVDIDVADIQSQIRIALQNMVHVPTPQETLPVLVRALNADDGNLTLPRGTYLHMAEGLALVKHHVNQNTELQDMVASLIPSMARVAREESLFEPLESASELARKGLFFPTAEHGAHGGRDMLSRMPDMARQTVRAVKLMQPALEHAVNGSVALTQRTQTANIDCDDELPREIKQWILDFGKEEKKKKNCNTEFRPAPKGGKLPSDNQPSLKRGRMCLFFDPSFTMGSFGVMGLSPKRKADSKESADKVAGLAVDLSVGLIGAMSGTSYRKWRKLTHLLAAQEGVPIRSKILENSRLFMGMALSVHWKGKYRNGKTLGLVSEIALLFNRPTPGQSPLSSIAIILNYADTNKREEADETKAVRHTQAAPGAVKAAGSSFNYATWGGTVNRRIMGSTTVSMTASNPARVTEKGKSEITSMVSPNFGVTLGDLKWATTWPGSIASSWSWNSKWSVSPSRKWKGLGTRLSIPFLNDCITYQAPKKVAPIDKMFADLQGLVEVLKEAEERVQFTDPSLQELKEGTRKGKEQLARAWQEAWDSGKELSETELKTFPEGVKKGKLFAKASSLSTLFRAGLDARKAGLEENREVLVKVLRRMIEAPRSASTVFGFDFEAVEEWMKKRVEAAKSLTEEIKKKGKDLDKRWEGLKNLFLKEKLVDELDELIAALKQVEKFVKPVPLLDELREKAWGKEMSEKEWKDLEAETRWKAFQLFRDFRNLLGSNEPGVVKAEMWSTLVKATKKMLNIVRKGKEPNRILSELEQAEDVEEFNRISEELEQAKSGDLRKELIKVLGGVPLARKLEESAIEQVKASELFRSFRELLKSKGTDVLKTHGRKLAQATEIMLKIIIIKPEDEIKEPKAQEVVWQELGEKVKWAKTMWGLRGKRRLGKKELATFTEILTQLNPEDQSNLDPKPRRRLRRKDEQKRRQQENEQQNVEKGMKPEDEEGIEEEEKGEGDIKGMKPEDQSNLDAEERKRKAERDQSNLNPEDFYERKEEDEEVIEDGEADIEGPPGKKPEEDDELKDLEGLLNW